MNLHHVNRRNTFGNRHNEFNAGNRRFHDCVSRSPRRHKNHRRIRLLFCDSFCNGVVDRNRFRELVLFISLIGRPTLTWGDPRDDICSVFDHLFRVECPFAARDSLHDQSGVLVDEYAHRSEDAEYNVEVVVKDAQS